MTNKFKVRLPNESTWDIILIDLDLFIPTNEFDNEIFGRYKGIYISILKETEYVFKEGN